MEIEVGEYVRTKRGYIRKVIRRDMDKHILLDIGFEGANYLTKVEEKEDIVKHSKKIINLVELGDYVNGYKVRGKTKEKVVVDYYCYSEELAGGNWLTFYNDNIKSILTKEAFKEREYVF